MLTADEGMEGGCGMKEALRRRVGGTGLLPCSHWAPDWHPVLTADVGMEGGCGMKEALRRRGMGDCVAVG